MLHEFVGFTTEKQNKQGEKKKKGKGHQKKRSKTHQKKLTTKQIRVDVFFMLTNMKKEEGEENSNMY